MDLCTLFNPFFSVIQQMLDLSFSVLSLVGIQAPQISSLLSPVLGCST